uniref:Uncharacterized protein n=1 Tax=Myoviridae sp. ct1CM14 TaxID=2825018 RepID=A0A8S5NTP4_9CAUD|nr:MAG TPA: hypothetical protein [Myoviridae sp. ct1CM14]
MYQVLKFTLCHFSHILLFIVCLRKIFLIDAPSAASFPLPCFLLITLTFFRFACCLAFRICRHRHEHHGLLCGIFDRHHRFCHVFNVCLFFISCHFIHLHVIFDY